MGAFVWEVENEGAEEVEVSIMFTFQNGTETKEDRRGGHWNEPFSVEKGGSCVRGVMLHHVTPANPYTLAISAREKVGNPETPQGLETVHGSTGTGAFCSLWGCLLQAGREASWSANNAPLWLLCHISTYKAPRGGGCIPHLWCLWVLEGPLASTPPPSPQPVLELPSHHPWLPCSVAPPRLYLHPCLWGGREGPGFSFPLSFPSFLPPRQVLLLPTSRPSILLAPGRRFGRISWRMAGWHLLMVSPGLEGGQRKAGGQVPDAQGSLAGQSPPTEKGEVCAAAVCATCVVAGHGHGVLELGLAWDIPRIRFGSGEKEHRRWVLPGKG